MANHASLVCTFATIACLGNYIDELCMVSILYIPDLCPHACAVTTMLFDPHCDPHTHLPRMLNVSIALSIAICARSANLFLHLCTITLDGATVAWQGRGVQRNIECCFLFPTIL